MDRMEGGRKWLCHSNLNVNRGSYIVMKFGVQQLKYEIRIFGSYETHDLKYFAPRGGPHEGHLKMTFYLIFGRKSVNLCLNESYVFNNWSIKYVIWGSWNTWFRICCVYEVDCMEGGWKWPSIWYLDLNRSSYVLMKVMCSTTEV